VLAVRPCRQGGAALLHEGALRYRQFAITGLVSGGHDAAFAQVGADQLCGADAKRHSFAARAEQPVFPKSRVAGNFEIGAKALARVTAME
jgi:hypothetical protein